MLVQPRTVIAVLLALALFSALGFPLPFDASDPLRLVRDVVLFSAYLYATRTLFRLPFITVIVWQRFRKARRDYGMNAQESLIDGLLRGLLDRRRWSTGVLAQADRIALVLLVALAVQPGVGLLLTQGCGALGALLLLVLYTVSGRFALALGDAQETARSEAFAFLRVEEER